jgi:hypothetical protein
MFVFTMRCGIRATFIGGSTGSNTKDITCTVDIPDEATRHRRRERRRHNLASGVYLRRCEGGCLGTS